MTRTSSTAKALFRDATLQDLPGIVEIYNSTIASRMVTADTEPVVVESRIPWFQKHNASRPLLVMQDEHKSVVGWVSFQSFYGRPAYNATAEISIYIAEDKRGMGLGRLALTTAIERCGTLGITTLLGFIFAHNEPSLELFTTNGFQRWGLLPDIAVLDGVSRSLVIVGKRIE